MRFLPGLLTLLLATSSVARKTYSGTKIIRVVLGPDEAPVKKLDSLLDRLDLETWTARDAVVPNTFVDIQVPKEKLSRFTTYVKSGGFQTLVMHEDLEESIKVESVGSGGNPFKVKRDLVTRDAVEYVDASWFTAYHPYNDHIAFNTVLQRQYPNNSRVVTAGKTHEGRTITGIHLFGSSGPGKKPAAIIHGTVHAREWIATMVAEYTAYALISNYKNDTLVHDLLENNDFYILPIVNPDGFQFGQDNDRLWRKNREQFPASQGCVGVDINRNWPYKFYGKGSSTRLCDAQYRGPDEASTPEVKALLAFQEDIAAKQGARYYMDFHSYRQMWLYPYGFDCNVLAADDTEFNTLYGGAVEALGDVWGTNFTQGPICKTIYQVAGGSVDYSYDVTKIKYSFAVELRDTGNFGFVLPPDQIWPSVTEAWEGTKYVLANSQEKEEKQEQPSQEVPESSSIPLEPVPSSAPPVTSIAPEPTETTLTPEPRTTITEVVPGAGRRKRG